MPGPIKPDDVEKAKIRAIPEEVFEVFNALIVREWDGRQSIVKQDEAAERIAKTLQISEEEVFSLHYLDVEQAYREAGWSVKYDKPGYNESYPSTFHFKRKN